MKIVKLYADWCGPCRVLEDMLRRCDIKHESVDAESPDGEGLSIKYHVRNLPTLLILDDDENLLRKMTGLPKSTDELTNFIYATN